MGNDTISRLGSRPDVLPVGPATAVRPAANDHAEQEERQQAAAIRPGSEEASALERAVERLRQHVREVKRELRFSIDEVSNRVVVTVVDGESGETIRQIPGEEVLRMARNLDTDGLQLLGGDEQRA